MKIIFVLLLALSLSPAYAADYKVGDRLNAPTVPNSASFQEVGWDDLMPKGWDPMRAIKELKLDKLQDSDPRAIEAMDKLRAMWNNAPANPAIADKSIRIAGFMVPLEFGRQEVKEFLLVPYFGACIHVPPPPANQVIHVTSAKSYKTKSYMDAVWIEGRIELASVMTDLGEAGYRMTAAKVSPYKK